MRLDILGERPIELETDGVVVVAEKAANVEMLFDRARGRVRVGAGGNEKER